ncbi:uncharacterized protein LOC114719300 [Neltuma alba]|uniref:uncharacterized protein LOC114719300 n=1 Tax=Neltuma alba TaxID=207710 RepID=UPI0010A5189F|nr:uncharacterized protein LOC114719300 [Prosopis alba]XP_028760617.1 uncharacterized protein LOC114719300 [Prosopis alba]
MVQRKVPSKLGVQADHHVKSDKRLANLSQDGKTRGGADMKKKMKKSRSIKLSDMEILKSTPSKKSFSQPGKPPPFVQVHPPVSSSSPQKQTPLIRKSDGSPNYMKPTSSSDAKKELFPVSIGNAKCNSKSSSVSAKKPAKALTKSSPNLKLVRTLTKTPSFKKSSRVSLCADLNAQRATCSSTLKDSKFPPYLMLNPGATESEGTSVRKVCPYTYCSLNEAEFADEKHLPIWSGEEISIGSYCSEGGVDGSTSVATDMEWEHEEDDADSPVLTEENDSKVESSSESSHDVSVMWLDDIIKTYYENVVAEVSQESNATESIYFESQHHGIHCGMERTDDSLETQGGNSGENETVMDATVHSSNFSKTFEEQEETGEQILESNDVSEAENLTNNEVLELESDGADCITTVHTDTLDEQENTPLQQDDSSMSQADRISDASRECYELNQFETEEDVAENHFAPVEEPLIAETNNKMEEEDNADFQEEIVGNYVSDASQDGCESSEVESSQGQKVSESCEADKVSEKENSSQDISEEDNLESSSSTGGEEKGPSNNWKGAERRKRAVQEEDEMRKFNPREPNFLPLVPDPEAEKVDLKHQMMDERKNAEEWMLDYALRQTVTKLAPARKRKVALLVEAFESVTPIPKCETHMRNKSSFAHPRPIQACR